MLKDWITGFIDRCYPPFRKFMPLQTFRYAACGGGNTLLDIALYIFSYNFILKKQVVYTPFTAISPHVAAIFLAMAVSFPVGFYMNRYIVFPGSTLRRRIQLFRYFILVIVCLTLNYFFIKLFVEICHFYPAVAKLLTTVIVVSFSYLSQKYFTFKVTTAEEKL